MIQFEHCWVWGGAGSNEMRQTFSCLCHFSSHLTSSAIFPSPFTLSTSLSFCQMSCWTRLNGKFIKCSFPVSLNSLKKHFLVTFLCVNAIRNSKIVSILIEIYCSKYSAPQCAMKFWLIEIYSKMHRKYFNYCLNKNSRNEF